jgi:6-phosphogluconate dehydrogenase
MCPGSDDETMAIVLPILSKIAAKAPDGTPCVAHIGTGGGGHYCKMIHNGIEHGMMSAIAEAWAIMHKGLGMDLDAVGDELHKWNKSGELEGTFLVRIGAEICHTKAPDGARVLESVGDKVVQDYCGEEGTGIWSNTEAVDHHVPAPTLTASHFMRVASADLAQRRIIEKTFENKTYPPQAIKTEDKAAFLEDLRLATYISCLASFTQGLNVIDKADKANHFNVDYAALLQIWRAGCIIQADYISEKLLQPIYKDYATKKEKNPLYEPVIAKEFSRSYDALKRVVLAATVADHPIPALANTLDYIKYQTSTDLPTAFSEAQLDYFGRHMYDLKGVKGDPEGLPDLGKHHFEWKPA